MGFHIDNQIFSLISMLIDGVNIDNQIFSLISMLIDGVNIDNQIFSQQARTSAQQIMYNVRINKDKKVNNIRLHLRHKETPLSIYIALKIYVLTRSKTLIECLHKLGICISYARVLDITKDISQNMLYQYQQDGVFLLSVLKKYTMIVKDNVDINAKSSTALKHLHATSVSVLQCPSTECPTPLPPIKIDLSNRLSSTSKKTKQLPETYANVKPISSIPSTPLNSLLFAPVCTINVSVPGGNAIDVVMMEALTHETEWLEGVHTSLSSDLCKSWAQHHAAKNRCDSSYWNQCHFTNNL